MKIIKVCMDCGNEMEDDVLLDSTLICSKCGSGDIYQPMEMDYEDEITLEDCFAEYFTNKIASIFDADNKLVIFMEE